MKAITVYRIRFWDINTSNFVLSEGFLTQDAASAEHVHIDSRTALQVDCADVRDGRYIPPVQSA
ncbi:hypothetical protein [Silvimonas sp.]|uniref:hypothetical protein n=1 Tax=Silvimonas sp. TaxID=2650811 RepID=UPI0028447957|nr:hypothetical protein [Silvimonas sp.]MDR3428203.1 hypothetical protein [Silvimonas sp.]